MDTRTERLLSEADRLSAQGKYVMIACVNFEHAKSCAIEFVREHGGYGTPINPRIAHKGGMVSFETCELFDWEALRFPWQPENAAVLVPPETIEKMFAGVQHHPVFSLLHKYD